MKKTIIILFILLIFASIIAQENFTQITSYGLESITSFDVSNSSVPELIDIDGDSLFDLIVGNYQGKLFHYEQTGDHPYEFYYVYDSPINSIDVGSYSAATFSDIDNDGLLDMIVGEYDGNLNHFEQSSQNSYEFTYINGSPINSIDVGYYAKPEFTDFDSDGLLDLLVGSSDGRLSHYEQDSVNLSNFILQSDYFNSIDIGNTSDPTFTDFESDGLLDMIIGRGNGRIAHYIQNEENSNAFTYVTDYFNSIDVGNWSSPIFIDFDNDGLLELVIGKSSFGDLYLYKQNEIDPYEYSNINIKKINFTDDFVTSLDIDNDGLLDYIIGWDNLEHWEQLYTNSVLFLFLNDSPISSIDIGSRHSPCFFDFDIDNDGLLDLIIGEEDGHLNHFEQSSQNSYEFTYINGSPINSIDVGNYSVPSFTDLDGNGLFDLLIGYHPGYIKHYEQIYSSSFFFTQITNNFNSIDVGTFACPKVLDIDNNGLLDLFIGREDGRISYYVQNELNSLEFTNITDYFNSIDIGYESRPAFLDYDNDELLDLLVNTYHYKQDMFASAAFIVNHRLGIAPLEVQFTDISRAGIISWQWDFDNDGTIDSEEQNPTWTYTQPGVYSVYLSVSNGDSTDVELKTDFIDVTTLCNFSLIAPTSYSVDVDIFPRFEWQQAYVSYRNGILNYEVHISTTPLFNPETTLIYETNDTFLYPPRDLIVGTTYFWKVKAIDIDNNGNFVWSDNDYWMLTTVFQTYQQFPMIDGLIADDRTLIPENSPYWLDTDPHTAFGKDVTIEAGTSLKFYQDTELKLSGNFFVYGTETEPVIFEGLTETTRWSGLEYKYIYLPRDSLVVDENNNYVSGNAILWAQFINSDKPLYCNCDIYVLNCDFSHNNTGIEQQSNSYIVNNVFQNSDDNGYAIHGGKYFSNNLIDTIDGYGIWTHSNAIVIDNEISNVTSYGINGGILVEDNEVTNCGGYGINADVNAEISRNIINNVSSYGINGGILVNDNEVTICGGYGIDADGNAEILRNIVNNVSTYGINGGILVDENEVTNCGGYGIECSWGATVTYNTIEDNSSYALKGGSFIDNNTIIGNQGGAIESSDEATITNNIIHNNQGHIILKGAIIENNDIVDNYKWGNYCSIESNYIKQFLDNNIVSNYDNYYSGTYLSFINFPNCDTLLFKDNIIFDTCNRKGNVLYFKGNSIQIESNVIDSTDSDYAVLWIDADDSNCSIIDNQFTNSTTSVSYGSAIYIYDAGYLYLNNNTISHSSNPSSDHRGAGIYQNNGYVDIIGNTITFNEARYGSAIWMNSADKVRIEENIITQNTGEYAIWGNPLTLTQNNMFYNYYYAGNDTTLLNLRYTGSNQESFIYNFWGTRSDQGFIDPSIYDDNEDSSIGMVVYQPILSAPSLLTPGQLTIIDSVLVTENDSTLTVNSVGAVDGQTVYLCIIGLDGNEFSLDITEVSVINMTTSFPLQPLMWETGFNTGIFRNEITISSTVYNPLLNIMQANIGDTLQITSPVDPSKVFYLPIIDIDHEIVVNDIQPVPGDVTVNEMETINFFFSGYDPDGNPLEYTWELDGVLVSTDSTYLFTTDYNSAGTYSVTLEVTDNYGTDNGFRNTLNYLWNVSVIDVDQEIVVNDLSYSDSIGGTWQTIEQTIYECDSLSFFISAIDPDGNPLEYTWELDGVLVSTDSTYLFTTDFNSAGTYSVTLEVTDNFETDRISNNVSRNNLNYLWNVTVIDVDQNIIVNDIQPIPGDITINEMETINFFFSGYDPDGNPLEYSWELDGVLVSSDSTYIFTTDYNSAGTYSVTLDITDNFLTDRISNNGSRNTLNYLWNVTVIDVDQNIIVTFHK